MDSSGQFTTQFIGLFLFFALMVIIPLIFWAYNNRSRKAKASPVDRQREKAAWLTSLDDEPVMPSSTTGDLPDLDLLLGAAPNASAPAPTSASKQSGTYRVKLANGSTIEAADVMVISRDLADGGLVIQIGDKAYPIGTYIADQEARRRFTSTLRDLVKQGEAMTTAPPTPAPAPTPEAKVEAAPAPDTKPEQPSAPVAPQPEPESAPKQKIATGERPVVPTLPDAPHGELPGDLPKFVTPSEPLRIRGGMPKTPVPELDIGGAVEAYLQYKLSQTPEFAQRSIHIHPAYGGGVKIEVDGRFYEAVSDIEDAETRDFIATAIEEWQSRQ